MRQNNELSQPIALDNCTFQTAGKIKSDLLVLRYMTQKIHLHLLNLPPSTLLPSVDYVEERHNNIHRIVLYNQQEILLKNSLMFVGFISRLQEHVSLATIQELHRIDKLLIAELAGHPGLLSYSSLELRENRWYNLVLLCDYAAKTYFKHNSTHRYASYQLAAHYYAWIRLHNGVMPAGLQHYQMILHSTKYYTYPVSGLKPTRREVPYNGIISNPVDSSWKCSGDPCGRQVPTTRREVLYNGIISNPTDSPWKCSGDPCGILSGGQVCQVPAKRSSDR